MAKISKISCPFCKAKIDIPEVGEVSDHSCPGLDKHRKQVEKEAKSMTADDFDAVPATDLMEKED